MVLQGVEEKEYSQMLHKALEGAVALHTFPKTTVDVFALVLQSGGGKLMPFEIHLLPIYYLQSEFQSFESVICALCDKWGVCLMGTTSL